MSRTSRSYAGSVRRSRGPGRASMRLTTIATFLWYRDPTFWVRSTAQRRQLMLLLSGRDESDGDFRYAPDKWSAKEVLGHVCDTERILSYRALRIARGDRTPIEGFEQDDYVRNAPFRQRPLAELIEDYIAVRRATLTLLRNLDDVAWARRGIANKNEVSVRALAYLIAGHELHHRRILEEKYFTINRS